MNPKFAKPKVDVHQAFMETRIRPVIKPLMVDLLHDQPANVLRYIADWCHSKEAQIARDGETGEAVQKNDESSDEEEALLERKRQTARKKLAVSGESGGKSAELLDFQPPKIKKSSAEMSQIMEILQLNFMFAELNEAETLTIAEAMQPRRVGPREVVICQGDNGNELFVVCSGTLICEKTLSGMIKPTFIKQMVRGDLFGELALLYNAPRAASIVAETDCLLFSLDRETFNHIVKGSAMRRRKSYAAMLAKVEILGDLEEAERDKICDCLQSETFAKGALVVRQGDFGKHLYFVTEGTAQAIQREGEEEKVVFEFGPNDYFGELSLINNAPRQASVRVTSERLTVASLDSESFKRLLGPIEAILIRNAAKYSKFISN